MIDGMTLPRLFFGAVLIGLLALGVVSGEERYGQLDDAIVKEPREERSDGFPAADSIDLSALPHDSPDVSVPTPKADPPQIPDFLQHIKEIRVFSPSDPEASTKDFFPDELGYFQALDHYRLLTEGFGAAVWKNRYPDGRWSELPPELIQ